MNSLQITAKVESDVQAAIAHVEGKCSIAAARAAIAAQRQAWNEIAEGEDGEKPLASFDPVARAIMRGETFTE